MKIRSAAAKISGEMQGGFPEPTVLLPPSSCICRCGLQNDGGRRTEIFCLFHALGIVARGKGGGSGSARKKKIRSTPMQRVRLHSAALCITTATDAECTGIFFV